MTNLERVQRAIAKAAGAESHWRLAHYRTLAKAALTAMADEAERLDIEAERLAQLQPPRFSYRLPHAWRLTKQEGVLFQTLLRCRTATKDLALEDLYDGKPPASALKVLDVLICRLRRKLKPHGVTIASVWGEGYRLEQREEWCARLGSANDNTRAAACL